MASSGGATRSKCLPTVLSVSGRASLDVGYDNGCHPRQVSRQFLCLEARCCHLPDVGLGA